MFTLILLLFSILFIVIPPILLLCTSPSSRIIGFQGLRIVLFLHDNTGEFISSVCFDASVVFAAVECVCFISVRSTIRGSLLYI